MDLLSKRIYTEDEVALFKCPASVVAHEGKVGGRQLEAHGTLLARLQQDFAELAQTASTSQHTDDVILQPFIVHLDIVGYSIEGSR